MLKGFCAYAREDVRLCRRLTGTYLKGLQRRGLVEIWHDGEIHPGRPWDDDIKVAIERADIVLLLISQDFMESDYITDVEVPRVMQRSDAGLCKVIPIHLSLADTRHAPFRTLQALPGDAKPVSEWGDSASSENRALLNVALGVEAAVFDHLGLTQYPDDVREALYAKFFGLGSEERDLLGQPVRPNPMDGQEISSERGTTGYVWPFTSSSTICWNAKSGARPVWGSIGYRHSRLGGAKGRLGFPLTDEDDADVLAGRQGGRYQRFEGAWDAYTVGDVTFGASIYWRRGQPRESDRAFPTLGGIGVEFEKLGGTNGVLGFPTSFEENRTSPQGTTGVQQSFQGGVIYYRGDGQAAVAVTEPIISVYRAQGGPRGSFGFPKGRASSDESNVLQEFEGGLICVKTAV